MRKALLTLLAAAPLAAALALVPGAGALPVAPNARVDVSGCRAALAQADRAATFTASQEAIPGASRMAMRFRLYERRGHARHARRVDTPELGVWRRSDPGVGRFVYRQRVTGLAAPAAYRMRVDLRWEDVAGRTVRTARVTSRPCRQPDLRPDLLVPWIHREGGRYLVAVDNRGRSPAPPTALVLSRAEGEMAAATVPALGAGERALVAVGGPPCAAGERLAVRVDPAGEVDEARERNDDRTLDCPR